MLTVSDLSKEYAKGERKVFALRGVSFEVGAGQFVSIIGKSGSGKSTLLSLLGALDTPTSGRIEVDGQDITALGGRALTTYRRATIGFVFQGYNLVPNLTALENVMLPLELAGAGRRERQARARELLEEVGLDEDKQRRRPGRLSGGEEQRVAIARALANRPKIVLADEPTGNLDSETGRRIVGLLRDLAAAQNTTILVVTHDLAIAGRTDATFRLKDGKLAA